MNPQNKFTNKSTNVTTAISPNQQKSTESTLNSNVPEDNDACVVCFKNVEIYSIGECDHPVCYECSTRMRVLCQQNECPICRHVLSKVIFTHKKSPYRELEAKNRSEYYSKKYKISFYTVDTQQAFFSLLDHPCPKCNTPPYRTFQALKHHVRREHDLHFCDLCTEHLKIFTFERRCYTQAELGLHRTKGDPDNRSHRGHPLCEYCNKRYLDRDELFRHLRREHYFCHFCDADGCNEFYRDYNALAEHFRQDHYLCEEGKCATEQFIGAFRTEIDYKAHVSSVHGKTLNKQQAKQTRTLQLEITLGPRGRAGQNEPGGIASVRSRGDDMLDMALEASTSNASQPIQQQQRITIDARNEQDFPSLGGAVSGPNLSLTRPPPPSMRNLSASAGLARTKENFPALGGGIGNGGGGGGVGVPRSPQQVPPMSSISSMLKKTNTTTAGSMARTAAPTTGAGNSTTGMVIHVSNRPSSVGAANGTSAKKVGAVDFPTLSVGGGGGKNKKQNRTALEEDMVLSPSPIPIDGVAAKHRTLVDDYVSVAHPSHFQKIQMVQKEKLEAQTRKLDLGTNAPKLTTQDFPSLRGGTNKPTATNWVKPAVERKQSEPEQRKSKVAPAPQLPITSGSKSAGNNKTSPAGNSTSMQKHQPTEQTKAKDKKQKDKKSVVDVSVKLNNNNGKAKEKNGSNSKNNNENKSTNANVINSSNSAKSGNLSTPIVNGNCADVQEGQGQGGMRPPPGFIPSASSTSNATKPPPGFQSNVTLNSVAKSPNNLTFTSSSGESYSIVRTHTYTQPLDAFSRNQDLVTHFREALKLPESFEEFRHISQKFREGLYKPAAYYEHCQAALGDKFDKIFPELLALLPEISKQQALYLVHSQRLNTLTPSERKTLPIMEVCSTCKQVLLQKDLDDHRNAHALKDNFPTLSSVTGTANKTTSNRKQVSKN